MRLSIPSIPEIIPESFSLKANPNPFNPDLNLSFSIYEKTKIEIIIYDINGEKLEIIQEGFFEVGTHDIKWKANTYLVFIHLTCTEVQYPGKSARNGQQEAGLLRLQRPV